MANVEQTIVDAADKLVKAVEVYGPKATSLVLETGRVAAMQDIARGLADRADHPARFTLKHWGLK